MKSCVVFRPDPPKLFMLNLNAWLILELCDGSAEESILQRYVESGARMDADADARVVLDSGLRQLQEMGLIILDRQGTEETIHEPSIVRTCP